MDLSLDFLNKYATEIIALCAIGFTGWNVIVQRKHNMLSVAPHLTISTTAVITPDNFGVLKMVITNNGLGPAYFKKFESYQNNKICDYQEAVASVINDFKLPEGHYTGTLVSDDHVLRPGDSIYMLNYKFRCHKDELVQSTKEKLSVFDITIEYECAYGTKKTLNTATKDIKEHKPRIE